MVDDCLVSPFSNIFDHSFKEVCLSDYIMSAYLGGPITAVGEEGGSTVVGSNTNLDKYYTAVQRGYHCILMRLISTADETP